MKRRVPRLAAAFVVTFSAFGCGPAEPPKDPEPPIHRNPPPPDLEPTATSTLAEPPATSAPVGTATGAVTAAPTGTAAPTAKPDLPPAPDGWTVHQNADGTCTAYGKDPCNHPGCNPPPPRKVACPPDMAPTKPKK